MPLSEHEQRLLEQMERALYAEDPKFATSMRSARSGAGDRKRIVVGVIAVLVGLGLLIARSMRAAPEQAAAPGAGGPAAPTDITSRSRKTRQKRSGESLSDRMEERWRRRRETGDF